MNKHLFRKLLIGLVLIQGLIYWFILWIFNSQSFLSQSLIVPLSLFLATFVFAMLVNDLKILQNRFKDIYPGHELSSRICFMMLFFPILNFGLVAFLSFKDSNSETRLVDLFKVKYALMIVISSLVVQLIFPSFAYLTASSATYNLIEALHETVRVIDYKKGIRYSDFVIEDYQRITKAKLSSTETVLLISINATLIIQDKNRAIASGDDKNDTSLLASIRLLQSCEKIIKIREYSNLEFWDFSPIQWLMLTGPSEIILLSIVEYGSKDEANKALYESSMAILNGAEKRLDALSKDKRAHYISKLNELKLAFSKTDSAKL